MNPSRQCFFLSYVLWQVTIKCGNRIFCNVFHSSLDVVTIQQKLYTSSTIQREETVKIHEFWQAYKKYWNNMQKRMVNNTKNSVTAFFRHLPQNARKKNIALTDLLELVFLCSLCPSVFLHRLRLHISAFAICRENQQ